MTTQVSDKFSSPEVYGDGGAHLPSFEHPDFIRVNTPYTPDGIYCRGRLAGSTACQRGYAADWMLKERKLYLKRLVGYYRIRDEKCPIFADWVSDWIIVGHGEIENEDFYPGQPMHLEAAAFKFQSGVLVLEEHWQKDCNLQLPAWLQYADFSRKLRAAQ